MISYRLLRGLPLLIISPVLSLVSRSSRPCASFRLAFLKRPPILHHQIVLALLVLRVLLILRSFLSSLIAPSALLSR